MMVEFSLSYLLAQKYHIPLLDTMFYVGLVSSTFSIFFSSTGGLIRDFNEAQLAKSYLGLKNKYKFKRTFASFSVNSFVVGSVTFFLLGFLAAFLI
jgi:hypothetical protein